MKLALQRSLTFWSGLLILLFLFYGWWYSTSHLSSMRLGRVNATHGASGIALAYSFTTPRPLWSASDIESSSRVQVEEVMGRGHGTIRAITFRGRWKEPLRPFPKPMAAANREGYGFFLPHWIALLAIALPWSILLLWRAKRRKKTGTAA